MRRFVTLGCSLLTLVHVDANTCDSGKACLMEEDQSALLQSMKALEAKAGKKDKEVLSPAASPTKRNTYCTGTTGSGMSEGDARRECAEKGSECPAIYQPGNDPGKFFLCPSDTTYMPSTSDSTVYPMSSSSSRRRRRRRGKGKGKGKDKGKGKSKREGNKKHYCYTMAKDFSCYRTGLPVCCTDNVKGNCPKLPAPCELGYGSRPSSDGPSYGKVQDYSPPRGVDNYDSGSASYGVSSPSYGDDADTNIYDSDLDFDYDSDNDYDSDDDYGSDNDYGSAPSYGSNSDSYGSDSPPSYGGSTDSYSSPSYGGGGSRY